MPIYEYKCNTCSFQFELRRNFGDDGSAPCPVCSAEGRRIFSPVPIIFKGSGFYITDSRAKNGTLGGGDGLKEEKTSPVKTSSDSDGSGDTKATKASEETSD